MPTPLVSVLMPVFNGERFLGAAVDSVLAQTFTDFELIVVDDGSTDATPGLLRDYARRDGRVRVVTQPSNLGVVAARNAALAHACGELVAVLDSDDVALPHRLATQVAFLRERPEVAALGGAVQVINEHDIAGPTRSYPLSPALVAWSMLFFNSIAHSTLMARRTCLPAGYPEGGAEDYGMLMPLSQRALIANLADVLVRYRTSSGGLTSRAWERQEQHADAIVAAGVAAIGGGELAVEEVRWLRGLSRNQYPKGVPAIAATGKRICQLVPLYVTLLERLGAPTTEIRTDAGVRLVLLAALAVRRGAPLVAGQLTVAAERLSPSSLPRFVSKAFARMAAARSPRRTPELSL